MNKQHITIPSLRGGRKPDAAIHGTMSGLPRHFVPRNDEGGNALWFILVAIGLLGLLTVMMSRSSSTSNETGNYEQNVIIANEILSYAKGIENAVQNLLARGCSENDLSFWHDSDDNGTEDASDDYYNPNSPTDHSCHIFDVAGAGMIFEAANDSYGSSSYIVINGSNAVINVGNYNEWEEDLVLILATIRKDLCISINNVLNVSNPSGDAPKDVDISVNSKFIGSYTGGIKIDDTLTSSSLSTKLTACLLETSSGNYSFYHVLHAR